MFTTCVLGYLLSGNLPSMSRGGEIAIAKGIAASAEIEALVA
jgi:hypothetical protein